MASKFLMKKLYEYEQLINENGCFEIPHVPNYTTIRNPIHPMLLRDRWMNGYGQPGLEVYKIIQPALQLASLFITEDCVLPWFTHLIYGRSKPIIHQLTGEKRVYLAPTKLEHARSSLQEVKANMSELADVLTLQFVPASYSKSKEWGTKSAYGITCCMHDPPWLNRFSRHDFPVIDRRYETGRYARRTIPTILLQCEFAEVFSPARWLELTPCQRYRIMFFFAVTLTHEIAHAYHWWFIQRYDLDLYGKRIYNDKRNEEPMWSKYDERGNELGFAWEAVTIGKIVNPLMANVVGVPCLTSSETHAWRPSSRARAYEHVRRKGRWKRLKRLIDMRGVRFTRIPVGRYGEEKPSWKPATWLSANQWVCADGIEAEKSVLSVVHVIPMKWIVSWFMEDEWDAKRRRFRREAVYEPKRLGPTFVLVYERRADTGIATLHYATRADFDPCLDDVGDVTSRLSLHDGCASFEYAD